MNRAFILKFQNFIFFMMIIFHRNMHYGLKIYVKTFKRNVECAVSLWPCLAYRAEDEL